MEACRREGGRAREGGRERWRERAREGGREGEQGKEGGRERWREGGVEFPMESISMDTVEIVNKDANNCENATALTCPSSSNHDMLTVSE